MSTISAVTPVAAPAAANTGDAAPATAKPASIIAAPLLDQAAKGAVDAVVFLKQAADAATLNAVDTLAAVEQMPLGRDRKVAAYEALRTISAAAQAQVDPILERAAATEQLGGVDRLWSMNVIRVRGADSQTLEALAGSGAVEAVVPDDIVATVGLPNAYLDPIEGAATAAVAAADTPKPPPAFEPDPNATYIGWGVKQMNARAAWEQGITGAGVTVASLDTGVITDHPGLKANYRGTRADGTQDHNYNWANFLEGTVPTSYPIDDVGHGTHTIGNSVGYDPKALIGIAPDAQFIAARGLGNAGGNMFGLMAAMEWMMAPTDLEGNNPRPDLAPDIVTNSWGGAAQQIPFLWVPLRGWRRAGIIPVFASGNTGRPGAGVGSVVSPGLHQETITVGATEKDESRAAFSNRGPSNYSSDVKPEVVAPGTNVYSAWTDGTFRDTFIIDGKPYPASGTSMATPHVAGAIALYLQAHPNATYNEVLGALTQSATTPDQKDEDTGYGRVQVEKLITSVADNAKLTPKERVGELLEAWDRAVVFNPDKDAPKAATSAA